MLLLLFVVRVMVLCFVSNSHKVMIAIIVMLPLNCCFGNVLCDFKDMKFQFHFKTRRYSIGVVNVHVYKA